MAKKILYPVAIVLSSLFAIIPLLQTGYFVNHEEFFPMFRLQQLYRGLEAGYIFPRWGPDWAWGFGYPFFNFYAPFSYYFAAFWHWLGFGLIDSVKIAFGASIILSGFTMYLWAKEFWGRNGGIVSSVAYMYLPYRFADIYTRGNLAESFAFVWLPLILYATHKVLQSNNNRITMNNGLLLSISIAALILTHNLTAVYFLPIMVAYVTHTFIVRARLFGGSRTNRDFFSTQPMRHRLWSKDNIKPLLLVACYMLLAFGLSAFFWFPAIYDMRFVRTQDMIQMWYLPIRFLWSTIGHTEHFDFLKQQFYPVHGILAGGGALVILIKFILTKKRSNDQNLPVTSYQLPVTIFSLLLIAILLFFISPFSKPIWEALPKQFHYIQFSWRLLIFVGLFISFLCGSVSYKITGYRLPARNGLLAWRAWPVTGLLIIWLIASSFPRLQTIYAATATNDSDITVERSWNWDRQFGTIGNTAQSEYLPKWVDKNNFQFSIFNFQKEQSDFIQIQKVNLKKNELVTFNTFYFPGWQASIDKFQIQIRQPADKFQIQENAGFIQIPVPAGEHEVKIWFGSTPWRRWSEAVSIISLLSIMTYIMMRFIIVQAKSRT